MEDGLQVALVFALELGAQPGERVGVVEQEIECPGQGCGAALGAGEQQRHQLVAQFLIAHWFPVLVLGLNEQGEDVLALCELGVRPPQPDLPAEQLVGVVDAALQAPPGRKRQSPGPGPALEYAEQYARRAHARLDHLGERLAQSRLAIALAEPEDDLEHHVLGDRGHARRECELRADRPAVDLALGGRDHAAEALIYGTR